MLTSKQRAFLKSEAHTMKPIVQIGKNGLNDQIKTSIRRALDARELIKVTLLQNTDEDIHDVAETLEEAEAFLEDCMASIVDNIGEVREFLDQEGMDVSGMSDEEIEDASEVFALSDGRYLIVEG